MATKSRPDTIKPVRAIWQQVFDDFAVRSEGVPAYEVLVRYRKCACESLAALQTPSDLSAMPKYAKHVDRLRQQLLGLIGSIDKAELIQANQPREAVFCQGVEVGMAVANVWAMVRFASNVERHARHSARAPSAIKWTLDVAAKAQSIFKEVTRGQNIDNISVHDVAKKVKCRLQSEHKIKLSLNTVKSGIEQFRKLDA